MRVLVHTKDRKKDEWKNHARHFGQVPTVGEFISLSKTGPVYRVLAVVHCPYKDSAVEAEIYGTKFTGWTRAIAAL